MQPLGAFVLILLEVQIISTCISHNIFCIFFIKQCLIKQQLNSVFVISGIIKVSASVISLDLDYSGYHKTSSNYCLKNVNETL